MPKARKVALIIATALVIVGTVIALESYAAAGFNPVNLSTVNDWEQTTNTLTPESQAPHTSLVVDIGGGGYGVRIEPSENDSFEVVSWLNSAQGVEVSDKGGMLTVKGYYKQVIQLMKIDLDFQDRSTVVKVPASYTGSITVESGSGSVDVSRLEGLSSLSVNMSSGHTTVTRVAAAEMSLCATSGKMDVSDIQANNVKMFASSGGINLATAAATQSIKLETGSGNHQVSTLSAPRVAMRATSGSIDAISVDATDVRFDVTSGKVNASLAGSATDYTIESSITSGHLSAPQGSANGSRHLSIRIISGYANIMFNDSPGAPNMSTPGSPETPAAPSAPAAPAPPPTAAAQS
ncbi:MAG: DUF4097 family beta strand repeat-containing protein [Gordonibacter sp.]|uniref:DUF4097 family beta strand repeat-containing protein n=1 Tax=Gordonibacter sp. TaxID=1968902 RepID=UPI002FCAFF33